MSTKARQDLPAGAGDSRAPAARQETGVPTQGPSNSAPIDVQPTATHPFTVDGRYSVVAWCQDRMFYPGDLICDLVEYRILRASSFKTPLKAMQVAHLSSLEEKLRQSPSASDSDDLETRLRAFQRYNCLYPATISYVIEAESGIAHRMEVSVEDTSAGGVKVCGPHHFEPGDPVTLHLELVGPDCDEIQFPSRVAWTTQSAFGLMFAGPPETRKH